MPRWIAGQLGLTARQLAEACSVAALIGTTAELCDQLVQRRDKLGLSYVLVSDEFMELFAPVVERLAGH